MLGVTNIPWSSHTQDEILEDWFLSFDSLFSFYCNRPLSLSSKSGSSSIGTHRAEISLALRGSYKLFPPVNLDPDVFAQTCWFCTQYQLKFETFQKSYKEKNISVCSTFMASFTNPSNSVCSWNIGSCFFVVFFSLSLSSSDIAKLCSNLVGTGKMKQEIVEGLLVNLNLSESRTCAVKQSEIQELSPSACTLPSRGLCNFFEAGSILMGKTPEDDVNL